MVTRRSPGHVSWRRCCGPVSRGVRGVERLAGCKDTPSPYRWTRESRVFVQPSRGDPPGQPVARDGRLPPRRRRGEGASSPSGSDSNTRTVEGERPALLAASSPWPGVGTLRPATTVPEGRPRRAKNEATRSGETRQMAAAEQDPRDAREPGARRIERWPDVKTASEARHPLQHRSGGPKGVPRTLKRSRRAVSQVDLASMGPRTTNSGNQNGGSPADPPWMVLSYRPRSPTDRHRSSGSFPRHIPITSSSAGGDID